MACGYKKKGKGGEMTVKNFICRGVLLMMAYVLVGWPGSYFYIVDGQMDWFRFVMLFGVLAGIPHMFLVINRITLEKVYHQL